MKKTNKKHVSPQRHASIMTVDDEEEDSDEEEEEEKWYKKYGLLPPPRDLTSPKIKRRVTWSELFFDLVFVVTLARLSEFIEENDNNGKELLNFTLYVFLIWNVWHSASDYGTRYGSNDLANMIYFSFYMLAGVGMAMNLREGIVGESRRGFAGSCMTAYLFQSMIHLRIWYTPPNQKAKDYAIFSIVFTDIPLILLFGTLCVVESLSNPCVWTLFTIAALNQQIVELALILSPRLRERVNVPVHLEHFTERKSLMMIIVLGEAVDDLVPRLGENDANLVLYVTTACLFLSVVCVKLLYFDSDTDSLENHAILSSPFSAFLWNNLHIPMSAGLVLLSSGMAEILECAVHEEESLSRGQRFVFLGLGLSLGALGLARTMHHRDWDELDKAVKADLDLGKWFQKKNKKVTDRAGLLKLLKQIFVAQQTFMLVSAVVYVVFGVRAREF